MFIVILTKTISSIRGLEVGTCFDVLVPNEIPEIPPRHTRTIKLYNIIIQVLCKKKKKMHTMDGSYFQTIEMRLFYICCILL